MAKLSRIQQQVFDCIKEHNDMKGLSSKYFYYIYCCSGKTDVASQEAFDELLEELCEEELLKNAGRNNDGESLYCLMNEEKHEASNLRGEAFAALQHEFMTAGSAELGKIAKEAMLNFIPNCGITNSSVALQALILAATIGTEGKCPLNPPEKALVNASFGAIVSNTMSLIYDMMERPIDEEAYGMMTMFCNIGGRETGMQLLRVILAFAYCDGDLSDHVAEKLESVFKRVIEEE